MPMRGDVRDQGSSSAAHFFEWAIVKQRADRLPDTATIVIAGAVVGFALHKTFRSL
jgi:hypothetical protein